MSAAEDKAAEIDYDGPIHLVGQRIYEWVLAKHGIEKGGLPMSEDAAAAAVVAFRAIDHAEQMEVVGNSELGLSGFQFDCGCTEAIARLDGRLVDAA